MRIRRIPKKIPSTIELLIPEILKKEVRNY
jgi:Tfp pilus assembly ATPase PilU